VSVVNTAFGKVGGTEIADGVLGWRGIPYAAPPAGGLRLRPPLPPAASPTRRARTLRSGGPVTTARTPAFQRSPPGTRTLPYIGHGDDVHGIWQGGDGLSGRLHDTWGASVTTGDPG
jgi:hypothetical protein